MIRLAVEADGRSRRVADVHRAAELDLGPVAWLSSASALA
jgi:hypothetical protein